MLHPLDIHFLIHSEQLRPRTLHASLQWLVTEHFHKSPILRLTSFPKNFQAGLPPPHNASASNLTEQTCVYPGRQRPSWSSPATPPSANHCTRQSFERVTHIIIIYRMLTAHSLICTHCQAGSTNNLTKCTWHVGPNLWTFNP